MKLQKKILAASMAGIMGVSAIGGTAVAVINSGLVAFAADGDSTVVTTEAIGNITKESTATWTLTPDDGVNGRVKVVGDNGVSGEGHKIVEFTISMVAKKAAELVYTGTAIGVETNLVYADMQGAPLATDAVAALFGADSGSSVHLAASAFATTGATYEYWDTEKSGGAGWVDTSATNAGTGVSAKGAPIWAGQYKASLTLKDSTAVTCEYTIAPKTLAAGDIQVADLSSAVKTTDTIVDAQDTIAGNGNLSIKSTSGAEPTGVGEFTVELASAGTTGRVYVGRGGTPVNFKIIDYVGRNFTIPTAGLTSDDFKVTPTKVALQASNLTVEIPTIKAGPTVVVDKAAATSWIKAVDFLTVDKFEAKSFDSSQATVASAGSHTVKYGAKAENEFFTNDSTADVTFYIYNADATEIATEIANDGGVPVPETTGKLYTLKAKAVDVANPESTIADAAFAWEYQIKGTNTWHAVSDGLKLDDSKISFDTTTAGQIKATVDNDSKVQVNIRAKASNKDTAATFATWSADSIINLQVTPAPNAQDGAGPSTINANGEAGSIERILSAYKIDLGSIKNLFSASDFSRAKINATVSKIATENDITSQEAFEVFFSVVFKTQWGQENIQLTFLQMIILALYL